MCRHYFQETDILRHPGPLGAMPSVLGHAVGWQAAEQKLTRGELSFQPPPFSITIHLPRNRYLAPSLFMPPPHESHFSIDRLLVAPARAASRIGPRYFRKRDASGGGIHRVFGQKQQVTALGVRVSRRGGRHTPLFSPSRWHYTGEQAGNNGPP